MLGIVVSRADSASVHVGEHLRDCADWRTERDDSRSTAAGGGTVYRTDGAVLRTFESLHLELEDVASAFAEPTLLVFASRHAGETGPLLTAHTSGNVGPAEYGGLDNAIPRAAPNALKRIRETFDDVAPPDYETGIECTHHGPSCVGCPSLFVELGSDQPQWDDPEGARAVAEAILALRDVPAQTDRTVVGIGGGHYAPRFDRILTETDWAVGHVVADWSLEGLGDPADHEEVIEDLFAASGTDLALIADGRPELRAVVENLGYRVVGETWLRETTDIPRPLIETLEDALGPVAAGLRFGSPATAVDVDEVGGDVAVFELPTELLAAVNGIDRAEIRSAAAEHTLAFQTAENGTRLEPRFAARTPDDGSRLLDRCVAVLERKYDDVTRTDGAAIATREGFDPAKAAARGVPEGPAFGRLADGEAVEIDDGRLVEPADVTTVEERRFPLEIESIS